MKNMKENLINKISEKVAVKIGGTSIKLSEKSFEACSDFLFYEPKISKELLKSFMKK